MGVPKEIIESWSHEEIGKIVMDGMKRLEQGDYESAMCLLDSVMERGFKEVMAGLNAAIKEDEPAGIEQSVQIALLGGALQAYNAAMHMVTHADGLCHKLGLPEGSEPEQLTAKIGELEALHTVEVEKAGATVQ